MPTKGVASVITSRFHKTITRLFGIKIKVDGIPNKNSTLFLANHLSWLDIMVIGQIIPAHFLSMIEVKSWPVAGWLATRAGTIYIHRGGKSASADAISDMSDALNLKHNVVMFPEGRVTDGKVRKFHSRLIQSAIDSNASIQPVAIRYRTEGSSLTHPAILFTDGITFRQSFIKVLMTKEIDVDITFLKSIPAENNTRKELTLNTENQIRKQLGQQNSL